MGLIYKIVNNLNGKFYIGKTENSLRQRLTQHRATSKKPKDYFHNALKKNGVENFTAFHIKEVREGDDINELEMHYIQWLKPHYNLKPGGEGGKHSPASIEKMKRHKKTPEHCENISKAKKGKSISFTEERNKHLSEVLKGKNTWTKNKKWWHNGVECRYCEEQPEGFVRGRLPAHKRGLTPGFDVGRKMKLTDEERQRRANHLRKQQAINAQKAREDKQQKRDK